MPIISVSSLVNVLHGRFAVSMGRILLAAGALSMAVADSTCYRMDVSELGTGMVVLQLRISEIILICVQQLFLRSLLCGSADALHNVHSVDVAVTTDGSS